MSRFLHGRSGCGPPNGRAATLRRIAPSRWAERPIRWTTVSAFRAGRSWRRSGDCAAAGRKRSTAAPTARITTGSPRFFDERPFEDKLDELGVLFERSAEPYTPSLDWTAAVVGDRDAIFPPANMLAYWKEKAVVKPLPHYPFGDPGIVSGYLKKD